MKLLQGFEMSQTKIDRLKVVAIVSNLKPIQTRSKYFISRTSSLRNLLLQLSSEKLVLNADALLKYMTASGQGDNQENILSYARMIKLWTGQSLASLSAGNDPNMASDRCSSDIADF